MDIQERRRTALREFVADHGGYAAVVKEFDLKGGRPSYLSQLIGLNSVASFGEKAAANWEVILRLPSGSLVSPAPQYGASVAHLMSQSMPTISTPVITWESVLESIKNSAVKDFFICALMDDAMSPSAPSGTQILFEAKQSASPGDAVIVKDTSTGIIYFRKYISGLDGWSAVPTNNSYPTLHSGERELEIVAVYRGAVGVKWKD